MAKKKSTDIWDGITEEDFNDGSDVIDEDIAEFNSSAMQIYGANVNYARQIVNITDSLINAERRILWAFYQLKAMYGKPTKCSVLVAEAMKYHNHGDISIYSTMMNMAQDWKTAVPYIDGPSNFGSSINASGYAAFRYAEAHLSQYAEECFFDDFLLEAIGTLSYTTGLEEPRFLPSKFPNILVNGSQRVGSWAYSGIILPYHISDIIYLVKEYMKNPDRDDIIIYPDLPTGCDIIENNDEIERICKEGKGNIRMRARIEIEDCPSEWKLVITNLPLTSDFANTMKQIKKLGKDGVLKLKHVGEESIRYREGKKNWVDPIMVVTLDKALDPKKVRADLFRLTALEKTLPLRFNVVVGITEIRSMSLKELVLSWLDQRRIYKSSMYNHTITKLRSDLDMLEILIEMTEKDNVEKSVSIIKNSKDDEVINALMSEYGMNSHQASIVADMKMRAVNADAHNNYVERYKKTKAKFDEIAKIAYDPKKIDKIILEELDDLRKYGPPDRRSQVVRLENEETISNTEHIIAFTTQGYIKKVPKFPDKHHTKNPIGALAQGDKVVSRIYVNNTDSLMLIDNLGRYTIMPVYEIPNTIYSSPGEPIHTVTKLTGKIKSMLNLNEFPSMISAKSNDKKTLQSDEVYVVTLSEKGMLKATSIDEYLKSDEEANRIPKKYNSRTMKLSEGDSIAGATFLIRPFDEDNGMKLLVFTKAGKYVLLDSSELPVTTSKDTMGLRFITPENGDKCVDLTHVFPENGDKYIVILTAKGNAKKVECEYLKASKKRGDTSYLANIEDDDAIIYASGINDNEHLYVITKNAGEVAYSADSIPTLTRSAKCKKLVPVPVGDSIINACVDK